MTTFGPEYHKIQTVFKRDERGLIIEDEFTTAEIAYLAPLAWRWTEKIDGTNIRLHFDGDSITVGGRTDNAQIPGRLMYSLGQFNAPDKWRAVFGDEPEQDVTIYGEGYGAGIQNGGAYRQDTGFIVFDVKVGSWWLRPADVAEIATKLGMDTVPVVGEMTLSDAILIVKNGGLASAFPGVKAEGIVGVPAGVTLFDRKGDRLIVKLKQRDFEDVAKRAQRAEAAAV